MFSLFTWRVPHITGELLTVKEKKLGIHVGDAETSIMLAILPEQVRMEAAIVEYSPEQPEGNLLGSQLPTPTPSGMEIFAFKQRAVDSDQ